MRKFKLILIAILSLSLLCSFTACRKDNNNANPEIMHSFSLNYANVELGIGETHEIVAAYGNEVLTYTVDKSDIATVDANGKVTALKEGVAYVTISAGTVSRTCKITVVKLNYSVEIIGGNVNVKTNAEKCLEAVLKCNGEVYSGSVTWSVSGGTLSNTNSNITWFMASEKGNYTITARSGEGATTTCVITVIEDLADLS